MIDISKFDRIVVTEENISEITEWYERNGSFKQHTTNLAFNMGFIITPSPLHQTSIIHFFNRENHTDAINKFMTVTDAIFENKEKMLEAIRRSEIIISHILFANYNGKITETGLTFYSASNEKEVTILPLTHSDNKVPMFTLKEVANLYYRNFVCINEFIRDFAKERVHIERVKVKSKTRNGIKKISRKVITIRKKIFIYDKQSEKRQFNRVADTWGVRGHWRQYKSGKRVWVTPYKKGVGEKEGKEYMIQ